MSISSQLSKQSNHYLYAKEMPVQKVYNLHSELNPQWMTQFLPLCCTKLTLENINKNNVMERYAILSKHYLLTLKVNIKQMLLKQVSFRLQWLEILDCFVNKCYFMVFISCTREVKSLIIYFATCQFVHIYVIVGALNQLGR